MDPPGAITVKSAGIEVEFPVLAEDVYDLGDGCHSYRFMLPPENKIRLRPSDELILNRDGEDIRVSFLGDLFDFGGLLPFKIIIFFGRGAAPD